MFSRILRPAGKVVTDIVKHENTVVPSKRKFGIVSNWMSRLTGTHRNRPTTTNKTLKNPLVHKNAANRFRLLHQLHSKDAFEKMRRVPIQSPAFSYTQNQIPLQPILNGARFLLVAHQRLMSRGFNPLNFAIEQRMLQNPEFLMHLAANQMLLKNNAGGAYGTYTKNINSVPKNVKKLFEKDKPKNTEIITDLDHFIPRSDVGVKILIQSLSSIEYDFNIVMNMNQKEIDELIVIKVDESLPPLLDLERIITAYNSESNLRVLSKVEHDKYTFLEAHAINPVTMLPETMMERTKLLKGGLPKEIIGYKSGISDYKDYTGKEIFGALIAANNTICDTLAAYKTPYLEKFAYNMKNYMIRRIGLQAGGAIEKLNEYALYDYLVYVFGSLSENEITETNKDVREISKEILNDLRMISILILKHIFKQNILYHTFKQRI